MFVDLACDRVHYDCKPFLVVMDPVTCQINKHPPLILSLLYTKYGQITPTALNHKRDACKNLIYNPNEPIDQIWVQITSYSLMAQAEKPPATSEQLINIGIIILQRAGVFTHDISKWLKRPRNNTTGQRYNNTSASPNWS